MKKSVFKKYGYWAIALATVAGCGGQALTGFDKIWGIEDTTFRHQVIVSKSSPVDGFISANTQPPNESSSGTAHLQRFNADGELVWQSATESGKSFSSVAIDSNGYLLIGGGDSVFQNEKQTLLKPQVFKYDPNGQVLWLRQIGSEAFSQITINTDNAGNSIVAYSDNDDWTFNYYFAKVDSEGNTDWHQHVEVPNQYSLGKVLLDGDGNIYWGTSRSTAITIEKYSPEFELLWTHTIDGEDASYTDSLVDWELNHHGQLVVLATVYDHAGVFNTPTDSSRLVVINTDGSLAWQYQIADNSDDPNISLRGNDLVVEDDGTINYANYRSKRIAGFPCAPTMGCSMWEEKTVLIRMAETGELLWRQDYKRNDVAAVKMAVNDGQIALVNSFELLMANKVDGVLTHGQSIQIENGFRHPDEVFLDHENAAFIIQNTGFSIEKWVPKPVNP